MFALDSDNVEASASAPASALAHIFLKALNNFMLSTVQNAQDIHSSGKRKEISRLTLEPEANELVVALQKFILDTISLQSDSRKNIRVNLDDSKISSKEDPEPFGGHVPVINENESDGPLKHLAAASNAHSTEPHAGTSMHAQDTTLPEVIKYKPLAESDINELRQHVFNNMPIRLLCFKSDGHQFEISLLDKGGILAHLATKMQVEPHNHGQSAEWLIQKYARYAILSHTWHQKAPGEVTYDDWCKGKFTVDSPGFQKLLNFCKIAEQDHHVSLGWMDTICINKESSTELDESIRSMYKWYRSADICIAYLEKTLALSEMHNDAWFTRGWTLQELLAPSRIKFYTKTWDELGEIHKYQIPDDNLIFQEIIKATTITPNELWMHYDERLDDIPISRRMEWVANRQVTRAEDTAYSLMGIFNVSISIAYGEGAEGAFFRLLKEILGTSKFVSDIFNWSGGSEPVGWRTSSLLPTDLRQYLHRSGESKPGWSLEPIILTHLGLRIQLLLAPGISLVDPQVPYNPVGDYFGITTVHSTGSFWHYSGGYNLLDSLIDVPTSQRSPHAAELQMTFGILNYWENQLTIRLQPSSLAVALISREVSEEEGEGRAYTKIHTTKPVILRFMNRTNRSNPSCLEIPKSDLSKHGMRLETILL